jgi:integral membrane sensor domain MASE1
VPLDPIPPHPAGPPPNPPWHWRHGLLRSVLLAAGYFLAGRLALALTGPTPFVSAFWPAIGLALAALVRWGPTSVVGLLVGAAAVPVSLGAPLWLGAAIAVGNVAGPWAAARWMGRAGFNPRLEQRRDLGLLIGAGCFGATVISAANGAAWLAIAGRISVLNLPATALDWWMGDLLGVLAAGVPLLTLNRRGLTQAFAPGPRLLTGILLAACAVAVTLTLATPPATGIGTLAWLLLPPVLLCLLARHRPPCWPSPARCWPAPPPAWARSRWPAVCPAVAGCCCCGPIRRCLPPWCWSRTPRWANWRGWTSAGSWRWSAPTWAWPTGTCAPARASPRRAGGL